LYCWDVAAGSGTTDAPAEFLGEHHAERDEYEGWWIMPDPGYLDGDPPSLASFILGSVVVGILFMVIKSCIWG
jgi:hypothetical protein